MTKQDSTESAPAESQTIINKYANYYQSAMQQSLKGGSPGPYGYSTGRTSNLDKVDETREEHDYFKYNNQARI